MRELGLHRSHRGAKPWRVRLFAMLGAFVVSAMAVAGVLTLTAQPAWAVGPVQEATRPDGVLGRWAAFGLLTVIALVWITLISVVVRVYLGAGSKQAQ